MKLNRILPVFLLASLACSDVGPLSGPGVMTATLLSPNGDEGAALISLLGEGLGQVSPVGDTEAYAFADGTTTKVVLINQVGGTLSFRFAVSDTLDLPGWVVHEVAGPDDALRSTGVGYALEFVP